MDPTRTVPEEEKWRFSATTDASQVVEGLDLSDKTILVTGGYSGLGIETSKVLASAGAKVIIAGRNLDAGLEAAKNINELIGKEKVSSMVVDLGSLQSVREFASQFIALGLPKLDIIICNAGIMAVAKHTKTVDGFEIQFGTNHLGHFLLVNLLISELLKSPNPRVVSVSSLAHKYEGIRFDDFNFDKEGYDKWNSYGQSKTANILFAVGLDKRYKDKGLTANALHPGVIFTNLQREIDNEDLKERGLLDENGKPNIPIKTVPQGASTSVWAAVAPELEGRGGNYLDDCRITETLRPDASDPEVADRLWVLSEQLVGLKQ